MNKALLLKTLKHLVILAGLGALSAVLVGVITFLAGINIATLPAQYQILATSFLPLIVAGLKLGKAEIDKDLAQQEASQ